MRYLTKRRNPIWGHRLGVMSTILETQVATEKLKSGNTEMEEIKTEAP